MSFQEVSHIEHLKSGAKQPCPGCDLVMDFSTTVPLSMVACPGCGTTMMVPGQLGEYELIRLLGEGAVGRVYLANDPKLERQVAVKILRQDLHATPKMWALLENEAKLAAGISHHNVIQVYTMGKYLGRPYIVMELAKESSLEVWMLDSPLSEEEAILVGWDVLHGLNAAAKNNLMHGDVKPANILMGPPGYIKITDFGLARFIREGQKVERWGTPYYIAPEKAQQLQEDFRSDIYSLGATLFHAVAGTAPFEGTTGEEVIGKSLRNPTPKLREACSGVSKEFSRVIEIMMARDPDERFSTYAKVISCFDDLKEGTFSYQSLRKLKSSQPGMLKNMIGRMVDFVQDESADPDHTSPKDSKRSY